MSTSATQSGTTRAGRSGKGLGIAAAALAVVIAAGFVFTVNQGSEVSVSNVDLRPRLDYNAEIERLNALANSLRPRADYNAEIDRLNALAEQVKAESHPAFNIEKTKMELAGQIGLSDTGTYGEANLDVVRSQLAQAKVSESSELNQPEWDNRMP